MAIAFDAKSNGAVESGTAPLNISHVMGSGANGLLLVFIQANLDTINSVTFNGASATQLITTNNTSDGVRQFIWGLLAPSAGTYNVVVSWTGDKYVRVACVSYTGVKQSGLPDASGGAFTGGGSSAQAASATVVADNCWVAGLATFSPGTAYSSFTNATLRESAGTLGIVRAYDTNGTVSAGSYTVTANGSIAACYANTLVSIAPAAAVVVIKNLAALGVG